MQLRSVAAIDQTLISELLDGTAADATKSSEAGFGSCRLPPASLAHLTITSVEHVTSLVPLHPSRRATPVSAQHCAAPISQDSGGRGPTIGPMRCAGQRAAKLLQALISIPSVLCLAALAGTARIRTVATHRQRHGVLHDSPMPLVPPVRLQQLGCGPSGIGLKHGCCKRDWPPVYR